ncbi:MAG: CoA transferase, partial [Actinomycetota bacterium]
QVPAAAPPPRFGPDVAPERLPLSGLKVADLSWVAAAPLATKILAHWGATVVRIESQTRPCLLRGALGHRDDIPDQENGIAWHSTNANKLSIALDLATAEAREVVRDLAEWADVVTESFTPGTMDRWGLGYDELRARNPELIMVSSCVMGQTGPLRSFAGFGNMAASVAGFFDITGWADRGPAGPYLAYTDYCSPRFTVAALLAAIDHRRRTGEGQHLDFSQMEAAVHLLAPGLVELQETGHRRTRRGNEDDALVPHGVYPSVGEDQWIAIAVEDDEAWRSLAIELRRPDLAGLDRDQRAERSAELDEILAGWTAGQDATGLTHRLQANGIAAHRVQNSSGCIDDPQLLHRNHFQWLPHDHARRAIVEGVPYTLSEADQGYRWAGPTYGQHTSEILEDILGYDVERIAELAIAGALE